jgi:hypothetical protein
VDIEQAEQLAMKLRKGDGEVSGDFILKRKIPFNVCNILYPPME